jgi:hypothetical protein
MSLERAVADVSAWEDSRRPRVRTVRRSGDAAAIGSRAQAAAIYVIPTLIYFLIKAVGLWHLPNTFSGMYANDDGMWAAFNLKGVLEWSKPFELSPFNPFSGMGSVFLPNTPWLNPAAMALALPGPTEIGYMVSYFIYFAELTASTILLCRVIGLGRIQSVVCAQIYLLLLFPPSSLKFDTLSWYSLAPVNAHLVALCNTLLALLLIVGNHGGWRNLAIVLAIAFASLSAFFSGPVTILTYAPAYVVMGAAFVIAGRPGAKQLLWQAGAVAGCGLFLLACGFEGYLEATSLVSTRSMGFPPALYLGTKALSWDYWRSAMSDFDVCTIPQTFLCARRRDFWLTILGLVAATACAIRKPSVRLPAICMVFYIAALYAWEIPGHVLLLGRAHVISTPYLMWAGYPFVALFISFLPSFIGDSLIGGLRERINGLIVPLLVLAVPAADLAIWRVPIRPTQPRPSNPAVGVLGPSALRHAHIGPISNYLFEHASIAPGRLFRGYTVSYFGDVHGPLRTAMDAGAADRFGLYVQARYYFDQHYGNRLQETDLWDRGIPTVEEYGQWIAKPTFKIINDIFDPSGEAAKGLPSFLHIYRLDVDLLPFLGARFLITDLTLDDPRLKLRAEETGSGNAPPIFLYEVDATNLGTWTPTRAIQAATIDESAALLRSRASDLRDTAITFEAIDGTFVPAERQQLRMIKGGFQLSATSAGESLILVPLQYSHCWSMSGQGNDVRLYRANGFQTLVRFKGEMNARFDFHFGLFGSSACRLQDYADMQRLGFP